MKTMVLAFLGLLCSLCSIGCHSDTNSETCRFAAKVHLLCYRLFPNEKRVIMKWLSKSRCSVLLENGKELFQVTGTHSTFETLTFAGDSPVGVSDGMPSAVEFEIISASLSNQEMCPFLGEDHRFSIAKLGEKFTVSAKGLDDQVGNQITLFFSSSGKFDHVSHGR